MNAEGFDRRAARAGAGTAATAVALAGAAAAYGAWMAQARRRAAQSERRRPPAGFFLEADGVRLHAIERGDGPPVVLIHGAFMTANDYVASPLLRMAARRYHAVAIDRPGYGYSERPRPMGSPIAQADLLREAAARLGLERPILVGHSFGATVALAWALSYPDEVAGVVFEAGVAFPTPRVDLAPFMIPAVPGAATLLHPVYRALMGPSLAFAFSPNAIPAAVRREMPLDFLARPRQLRADGEDFAALVPAAAALAERLGELAVPLAVVAGEEDRIVFPSVHAVPLSRAVEGATLRLAPGIGHMLHHFRPDLVMEAIDEVAARSGRAPRAPAGVVLPGAAAATP